jgi:hypothetical protein
MVKNAIRVLVLASLVLSGGVHVATAAPAAKPPSSAQAAVPHDDRSGRQTHNPRLRCGSAKIGAIRVINVKFVNGFAIASWQRPRVVKGARLNNYSVEVYSYSSGVYEQIAQTGDTELTLEPWLESSLLNGAINLRVSARGEWFNPKTRQWEGVIGCHGATPSFYRVAWESGLVTFTDETPDERMRKCIDASGKMFIEVETFDDAVRRFLVIHDVANVRSRPEARGPAPRIAPLALAAIGVVALASGWVIGSDDEAVEVKRTRCVNTGGTSNR